MPFDTFDRYVRSHTESTTIAWNRSQKCRSVPHRMGLRILLSEPATIRWTSDEWSTFEDLATVDTELGVHTAVLPTEHLGQDATVVFTFRFADHWEGTNYQVRIEPSASGGRDR